jgi:hypothetical protein
MNIAGREVGPGHLVRRRFWAKVDCGDGCWNWIGATLGHPNLPYGRMWIQNKQYRAHRISWIFHYGQIPAGLLVCHRCDNPRCVRPSHLFVGTQGDNLRDMEMKNRGRKSPSVCMRGHRLEHGNVYWSRRGTRRSCRKCVLERSRLSKAGGRGKGWKRGITHCAHGHEYDTANTYVSVAGKRHCRKCRAAAEARRRERIQCK